MTDLSVLKMREGLRMPSCLSRHLLLLAYRPYFNGRYGTVRTKFGYTTRRVIGRILPVDRAQISPILAREFSITLFFLSSSSLLSPLLHSGLPLASSFLPLPFLCPPPSLIDRLAIPVFFFLALLVASH